MTDLPPSAPIVAEIVGRGGGNAFFLEELSVVDRPERLPGSIREIVQAQNRGAVTRHNTRALPRRPSATAPSTTIS